MLSGASVWGRHRREVSVAIAIAALAAVLLIVAPGFFAPDNLLDLCLANLPVLIVALGMTLVILTGQIDISVGSVFAICGVTAGWLAKADLPLPLVVIGTARRDGARTLNGAPSPTRGFLRSSRHGEDGGVTGWLTWTTRARKRAADQLQWLGMCDPFAAGAIAADRVGVCGGWHLSCRVPSTPPARTRTLRGWRDFAHRSSRSACSPRSAASPGSRPC